MTKDSHYYALLAFARALGFKKTTAHQIAYASQFVDDAKINHITLNKNYEGLDYVLINDEPSFYNMSTCHSYFKMKTYNYAAMTANTSAFHFVPGCSGKTFTRKMRCKQKNPVMSAILTEAIPDADPVKFGMLLHSFADTFAHQGFSGIISRVNDIKKCKANVKVHGENLFKKWGRALSIKVYDKCFDTFIPAYGHGQAASFPDQPYLKWEYVYEYLDKDNEFSISTTIDNRKRYISAFHKIQQLLEQYLNKHPELKDDEFTPISCKLCYKTIIKKGTVKQRIKYWQEFYLKHGLFKESDDAYNYDEEFWLKESFADYRKSKYDKRQVKKATLKHNFAETSWYKFYQAVHWYKPIFFQKCKDLGVDIPNEYI